MLLSVQLQRLINIHLSKFIKQRLQQPSIWNLNLSNSFLLMYVPTCGNSFFCVCMPLITSTFTFILLLIHNYARLTLRINMNGATQEFQSKLKAKLQLSTFSSLLRWLKTDSSTFQYVDFDGPFLPLFISMISRMRCNFWHSYKKKLYMGFRATLNYRKFKVALSPMCRI